MSSHDIDRRAVLRLLSAAPVAAGFAFSAADAQEAHRHARAAVETAQGAGAAFTPRFFTTDEYEMVRILCDLIIPRDERSGSATDAGVPEFMDFIMVARPAGQVAMRGGLAWLDHECERRFDARFVEATDARRRSVLDDISGPEDPEDRLSQGRAFFRSFRDLTASGFWTSKMGIEDLEYMGNTFVPEWKGCPPEVLKKLGLARE